MIIRQVLADRDPVTAPAHAPSRALFADISDNNADFDARAYRSAGHIFIAIKATQGTDFVSRTWSGRVSAAHGQHLGVGHYHFCQLENPVEEAQHFWGTVRPRFNKHVDRLLMDLEIGYQADWPKYIAAFDNELHRLSGQEPIGYTFASGLSAELKIRGGLWWVAAWGADKPDVPSGLTLWGWQYASPPIHPSGGPDAAAGIGACDMSVMRPVTIKRIQEGAQRAWPGR